MTVFWLSFAGVMLAMLGLSAGVLLGRRPLEGSCGGLGNGSGVEGCAICAGPGRECRRGARRSQGFPEAMEAE